MIRFDQLVGLRLAAAYRTMDLHVFQFGDLREQVSRTGRRGVVGAFALHVQCPWRIVSQERLLVGSGDRYLPRGFEKGAAEEIPDDFESGKPGATRADAEVERVVSRGLVVTAASQDATGSIRLVFDSGCALEVFVHSDGIEQWRLFVPGSAAAEEIVFPPEA
jgi:hypothetical protein